MEQTGTNLLGEGLHVDFDRNSGVPIHAQLEVALREAIRSGRLPGDSVLPATRRLADQLGISRGVVVEAYSQLTAEGYLVSTTGGYTRVARDIAVLATPATAADVESGSYRIDFRYGRPDVSQFPRTAWLRTLRTVLNTAPNDRLSYQDGRGTLELRTALAEYLNRVRGTWASPDRVIVCNGYAQAVNLIFPVLAARGVRRLAVEDPSDPDGRGEATAAGIDVVPVPVTPTGIDTDALEASGAQAVLLTPAHQFPAGSVLSPERRAAVVNWARTTGGVIIEDDYDAEYRYDATPVGALHGLAPEQVIYAGTASKTLAPGLRLGWMIAPEPIAQALADRKRQVDRGSPIIDQLAFAEFLNRGEFDRHLRRMRPIYRRRRDVLLHAMRRMVPELEPVGIAAGLHILCWLPDGVDEEAIVTAAAQRGLVIDGLEQYRVAPGPGAIIIGYANSDEPGIAEGVAILREALREAQSSPGSSSGALLPAS